MNIHEFQAKQLLGRFGVAVPNGTICTTAEEVRAAAEKIGPAPAIAVEPSRPLSRKTAAERVLFYRRVLAAWEFLIAMDAQPALAELRVLIELERTPVRPRAASSF